ncbi:MAG: Jag N-terminal domain-containing protein, partial [Methylococcus sp.]
QVRPERNERTMQWIETTGQTVEEAKEVALDQLGVDEMDAEFEIVEEPKAGLLVGHVPVRAVAFII